MANYIKTNLEIRKRYNIKLCLSKETNDYGFDIVKANSVEIIDKQDNYLFNKYIINRVYNLSPTHYGSLLKGDYVIEINNINVSKLDLREIYELIENSKKSLNGILNLIIERITYEIDEKTEIMNDDDNVSKSKIPLTNSYCARDNNKLSIFMTSNSFFWRILRMAFKGAVFVTLAVIMLFILVVIILAPKCVLLSNVVWWKNAVIYRIELEKICNNIPEGKCFKDLIEKSEYFTKLNANGLLLSNIINQSHDFVTLNKTFGNIEDFKLMLETYHSKNIKIVIDFIPNFTNDDNPLFLLSKQNPDYRDYYIWSTNPNNWVTLNGEPAWTHYNGLYYLHQFGKNKPDLNYRNPKVFESLLISIKYWLDLGVDGMNLMTVSYIYEDILLRNESVKVDDNRVNLGKVNHEYSRHQRETIYLIAEIKHLFTKYTNHSNSKVLLLDWRDVDTENDSIIEKYYGSNEIAGFDLLMINPLRLNQNGQILNDVSEKQNLVRNINKTIIWTLPDEFTRIIKSDKFLSTVYAIMYTLQGSLLIDFDSNFYIFNLSPNSSEKVKILNNMNHSLIQHISYSFENLFYKLSTIRSESKAIKNGYFDTFYYENLTVYVRYGSTENNIALISNFDQFNKLKLSLCSKYMKLSNLKATIKYSNIDPEESIIISEHLDDVEFNKESIPLKDIDILPYSSIVLTWPYQRPDIKDIL